MKEFIVVISSETPYGRFLLALQGKIGGAADLMKCGLELHPAIVCKDIDWVTASPFVRMTHMTDPFAEERKPKEIVVPGSTILFAIPLLPPQEKETEPLPAAARPQVH